MLLVILDLVARLLQLTSANQAGKEIAYGDWVGFVQACAEVNDSLISNQAALVRVFFGALKKLDKSIIIRR